MHTITATTHFGETVTESVINRESAIKTFNAFISCSDCADCVMINGLTGVVEFQWVKGKFLVIDEVILH